MSDGLTAHPASPELLDARPETAPRSAWVVVPAQALATWPLRRRRCRRGLALVQALGRSQRRGVRRQWYTGEAGLRADGPDQEQPRW